MRYDSRGIRLTIYSFLLVMAGCGSSGGGASTGSISISLMDRPVDGVTALFVTIDQVWIKPQGSGPAFELPMVESPMTVDLLSLTEENAALIVDGAVVDAGSYSWIEFRVDDTNVSKSYAITKAGGEVPVEIDVPSDRIRLVNGFDVAANQAVRFLFDWEVSTALTEAVGRGLYILKPAFRMLAVDEYGSISGKLTGGTDMADSACSTVADHLVGKVVYFFAGDVDPDDKDGVEPEPVTTVDAVYDMATGDYLYRAILMPGDYTVALTCLGDKETEDGDEDLQFLEPLAGNPVTVTAEIAVEGVDF